jgi:hypothetical protein
MFASAGPTTGVLETLATTIGSGLVVGSFVAGIASFVASRSLLRSEKWAVTGGYLGGGFGVVLLVIDILGKRFV